MSVINSSLLFKEVIYRQRYSISVQYLFHIFLLVSAILHYHYPENAITSNCLEKAIVVSTSFIFLYTLSTPGRWREPY